MSEQSTALRLADWLEDQYDPTHNQEDAAAELRRLHAVNVLLHERHHFDNGVVKELLEALTHVSDWFAAAGIDVPAVRHARAAIARAERNA